MAEKAVVDQHPGLEVTEKHVTDLLSKHKFSNVKWRELGLRLDVPVTELDEIEEDYRRCGDCLLKVITYWIRNGTVSWKVLWEALCHDRVGHKNTGCAIRDWYLEKIWNDKRKGSRGFWIQLIRNERRLQAILHHTQEHHDGKRQFYLLQPEVNLSGKPPDNSMFKRHYDVLHSRMSVYLKGVEDHQSRYKAGYEARFGHVYLNLPEGDHEKINDTSYYYEHLQNKIFTPQIEGDVGAVVSAKCDGKTLVKWLVDPLKFVVEQPAHEGLVYIAVISQSLEGYFVLHEVYQQQKQAGSRKATFDITQPRRSIDIRIADCCALRCQTDDPMVLKVAETITKSIRSDGDHGPEVGKLSMQLLGEYWHVKFFRHKKQQKHHWKDNSTWRLAEFDVAEFEMTEDLQKSLKENQNYDRVSVQFNREVKKEIELWSRKQFPSDYDRSRVSTEENKYDMSTGHVSMEPWTTEDLLKDFDKFVQAAFDITEILEK